VKPGMRVHASSVGEQWAGTAQRGATLIEIMVATLILAIVVLGMAEFVAKGRMGLDQEEHKRVGTLLAQEALERTVVQPYDLVTAWTERRTIDSIEYTISVSVQSDAPDMDMKLIQGDVQWNTSARATRTASLATFVYEN